ncbi:hypothetical protein DDR33_25270, partial [Pararcticibacter amylolyticus]
MVYITRISKHKKQYKIFNLNKNTPLRFNRSEEPYFSNGDKSNMKVPYMKLYLQTLVSLLVCFTVLPAVAQDTT